MTIATGMPTSDARRKLAYKPDMRTEPADLQLWKRAAGPESRDLIRALAESDVGNAAALDKLRRHWDPPLIATAIELVNARRKASKKFPDHSRLVADVAGVEQATSHLVAQHKARRFAQRLEHANSPPVIDLCCGIGGDAMALAAVTELAAVDLDPVRAWMTGCNARCPSLHADVRQLQLHRQCFHIDPDRRAKRLTGHTRRLWRYQDYQPGPAFISALLSQCPDGAVKLGPGIDFRSLPTEGRREIEIINENGTLVQAVLWCGALADQPGTRTATRLPQGLRFSATPQPLTQQPTGRFHRYALLLDPAIERAQLVGALCNPLPVRPVHPGLGILTSDEPIENSWLRVYAVEAQMPWRIKKIKQWLHANHAGIVDVKTRGRAVDPDTLQRDLRGDGHQPFTVFGLRIGRKLTALIAPSPDVTTRP